ncbi:hypothetical protein ACN2XU_23085 [Primorskyibacter sp. 2E107]|uniref:hypothetical protein n=1 Tax=Primorskyibacter sp. 2E107 TaxID=3403458 RepID=UPI003AF60F26
MKRTIALALIAAAGFAGTAQAITTSPSANDLHVIRNYAPQADLSDLTKSEANALLAIINSGGSEGSKTFKVRSMLQ